MGINCPGINCANINIDLNDCKPILTTISYFVYGFCAEHASYLCFLTANLEKLEKCLDDLKLLMDTVMDRVREAEVGGKQRTREVEEWFNKVATKIAEARRLKVKGAQECNKRRCTKECLSIYIVGKDIVEMTENLSKLKTVGQGYKREEVASSTRWFPMETIGNHEFTMVGGGDPEFTMVGDLEAVKKKVFGYLDGGEWIVGVYGQGGVGKTTLIRLINRYARTRDFLVIHVPVRDLTVEQIQEAVRAEIRILNDWRHESVEERAHYISTKLHQQQRRFVLLLDDIREGFGVEDIIGVTDPHREKGSKVVFTTRNENVSGNLARETVRVETLKGQDDLQLLKEAAKLNTEFMNSKLKRRADEVLDFCGGLPSALVKLGKFLAGKTEKEWGDMLSSLHNPASPNDTANSLFQDMRSSYDNLEGADYKECFLYCAFFPMGSYIRTYELEELWIYGDCSIHFNDFKDDPRARAREIIGTLVDEGLLEKTKEEGVLKMHNLVRCMALWLASKDRLVMAGKNCTDYKTALEGRPQGMKRLLSISNKFEKLDEVPKDSCRYLTTLFVTNNKASSCMISDQFFTAMRMLTVLNLSNSKVEQLPTRISKLGSLKYLDISFTNVTKLPQLKNLYYLNVNGLKLEFDRSKRVISTMSCLQVLRMLCRYGYVNKKKKKGEEEDYLVEELTSLERLDVLEIQVGSSSTLQKLFNNNKLLEKMRCLSIKEFEEGNDNAGCFIYLSEQTEKLVELLFTECAFKKLSIIQPLDRKFHNITKVTVKDCHYLLDLTCLVPLWGLEVLKVSRCAVLREIINREELQGLVVEVEGDDQQDLFCDLAELHLEELPELEFIYQSRYTGVSAQNCPRSLPLKLLRELHVVRCPKLKKFPYGAKDKQIQLHAPQTWRNAIDGEDHPPIVAAPFQASSSQTPQNTVSSFIPSNPQNDQ